MTRKNRIRRRFHNPRIPGLTPSARLFRVTKPRPKQKVASTAVAALSDDKGRWIGSVDPMTGRVFKRNGNPANPGTRIHATLREAANATGIKRSASVEAREEAES